MSFLQDIKTIDRSPRAIQNFAYVVGGIFAALGFLAIFQGQVFGAYLLILGTALVVLGIVSFRVLLPLYIAWMALGIVLGFFVTTIILTIFFYLIFTPLAFFLRLSGKRFIDFDFRPRRSSFWQMRERGTRSDLLQQF